MDARLSRRKRLRHCAKQLAISTMLLAILLSSCGYRSLATPPCSAQALRAVLPASAVDVSCVAGNFEGAGAEQLVVFALSADPADPQPWRAFVTLTSGRNSDAMLPTAKGEHAMAVGVYDAESTGHDIAFVQVHEGASTTFDGLYQVLDGQLQPVLLADAKPAVFAHGGSVMHQDAYGCLLGASGGPELITLSWTATNATTTSFQVQRIAYQWQRGLLVSSAPILSTTTSTVAGQPQLPEFGTLACGRRAGTTLQALPMTSAKPPGARQLRKQGIATLLALMPRNMPLCDTCSSV